MLRCTLEAARRNNFAAFISDSAAVWRKSDQKPDRVLPLASRFCARPFVIDASQQSARGPGNGLTVARMPQGKGKSGYPHEPPCLRLPLDHRFGMLRPGVRVAVEVVTMRSAPQWRRRSHCTRLFISCAVGRCAFWGLQNGARVHPCLSASG